MPIYCALNSKERGLTTFEFGGEWLQSQDLCSCGW